MHWTVSKRKLHVMTILRYLFFSDPSRASENAVFPGWFPPTLSGSVWPTRQPRQLVFALGTPSGTTWLAFWFRKQRPDWIWLFFFLTRCNLTQEIDPTQDFSQRIMVYFCVCQSTERMCTHFQPYNNYTRKWVHWFFFNQHEWRMFVYISL